MDSIKVDRAWFAVIDSRKGRLFEMTRTPQGRRHLEERDALAEAWDEKQHHRPYMLAGKGRSHAPFRHEDEERVRRFAHAAAAWLGEQAQRRGIEHVKVFCAKSILGPLRHQQDAALRTRAELCAEDLAWLTPAELAAHPAVAGLLP